MSRVPPPPELGREFGIPGSLVNLEPLPGGHIHDTWLATYGRGRSLARHVHQRVNGDVFADPAGVTEKVHRVSLHLRQAGIVAPELATGPGDRPYVLGPAGAVWRSYPFLDGARSFRRFPDCGVAAAAGAGFGRLLAALHDLPPPAPPEAIAGFHHFGRRLAAFEDAVAADRCRRAAGCGVEIERLRAAGPVPDELARAQAAGLLPERVVHNDAKADNMLIDDRSGRAAGVLDLDTVAPGTVLFDIGDLIRSGAADDDEDGAATGVRLDVVEALARGYLEGAAGLLTEGETGLLGLAGPLMAYEAGLRFVTDHLDGDRYFRIDRPGHNLDRARSQLTLLEALLEARPAVETAVEAATPGRS